MKKERVNKKRVFEITVKFLALMLLLTLLSRAAHNMTIAEVTTAQMTEMRIAHEIEATGEIRARGDVPIIVKEGILVSAVSVNEGEHVSAGDTLFALNTDDVKRLIKNKQQEINILDIQIREESKLEDGGDAQVRQDKIRRAQLSGELSEYKVLADKAGRIDSPVSGVIRETRVGPGDKTSGSAALLVSDDALGLMAVTQLPIEDEPYFSGSPTVEIRAGDGEAVANVSVRSVFRNAETPSLLDVAFDLSSDGLSAGQSVSIKISTPAISYPVCVPRTAIHQNGNSTYYVNTVEEAKTVLGTELRAARTEVTILDSNEMYAAIEGLLTDQIVILSSSRAIEENSRVKIVKNDVD